MTVISNNEPLRGMGKVLYGDIDDLITFLALVPDEQLRVKLWERSFEKLLYQYKNLGAIKDFEEEVEESNNVDKQIKKDGLNLIETVEAIKEILGVKASDKFIEKWEDVFIYGGMFDLYALRALHGKRTVGENLFRTLTNEQIRDLFEALNGEYISGDVEHFRMLFSGEGIRPSLYKPLTWLKNQQILRYFCVALKRADMTEKGAIKQIGWQFFVNKKGDPCRPDENIQSTRESTDLDNLKLIIEKICDPDKT